MKQLFKKPSYYLISSAMDGNERVNVESVVHGTTIIPLYTTTRLRMEYKDGVQRVV